MMVGHTGCFNVAGAHSLTLPMAVCGGPQTHIHTGATSEVASLRVRD